MKLITHIGRYFIMLRLMFHKFTKSKVMQQLIWKEINDLIVSSMGIVAFISIFIGAVVAIQTALNLDNPLLPKALIGFATRQSIILEFSPTFISIIMAGRIGSYITSSIGSMRVTEQIDALEVMGINTVNYLVFPKVVALMLYPLVITVSMFLGIIGGMLASVYGAGITTTDFVNGLQENFKPFHLTYSYIKTIVFAFILATVPAYHGYYMKGGALEVGKASTKSFVWTCITIIATNFLLTQLILG
ncbi:MAG: ABC transporter permease [Flavobacteriaceae bacterium]|nr:ABC transporter permease [Flavobacteriaceae bacterium]